MRTSGGGDDCGGCGYCGKHFFPGTSCTRHPAARPLTYEYLINFISDTGGGGGGGGSSSSPPARPPAWYRQVLARPAACLIDSCDCYWTSDVALTSVADAAACCSSHSRSLSSISVLRNNYRAHNVAHVAAPAELRRTMHERSSLTCIIIAANYTCWGYTSTHLKHIVKPQQPRVL